MQKATALAASAVPIERHIRVVRGRKVMLDSDLATLYGVTTGNLNLAVRRNKSRFPPDFMFALTGEEAASLLLQFAIPNPAVRQRLFAIRKPQWQTKARYLPGYIKFTASTSTTRPREGILSVSACASADRKARASVIRLSAFNTKWNR